MAGDKYQTLVAGEQVLVAATVTSAGVANAGEILALGADGRIDQTVLPIGVGPDIESIVASEALGAGDYVNIYDDTGTRKVRLADNSNGREAHGFVLSAFLVAATAVVYFEGPNNSAPTGVAGQRAYLGTAGGVLTTPLDPVTDDGSLHQFLGVYVDTDVINTDIDDYVVL